MEPKQFLVLFRWLQWLLSAAIFGITFALFLFDVNFYIYMPPALKAQVGLAGFLHIYMYVSAIWTSCVGGVNLFWACGDILFTAVALAVAGLSQPQTSTYCVSELSWDWNNDYFAFVPPSIGASADNGDSSQTFTPVGLRTECGLYAAVAALSGLLVILFVVSIVFQLRNIRRQRRDIYSQLPSGHDTNTSAPLMSNLRRSINRGARQSFAPLASPLKLDERHMRAMPPVPPVPRQQRAMEV